MLGQLSGEEETDSGLDLPGGDGGALVVVGKAAGLGGDALKDVVDKGVHDAHGLGGDTGVGVHLLQDLVDVDGIGLLAGALALLVSLGDVLLGLASLLGGLSGGLGGHDEVVGCSAIRKNVMTGSCLSQLLLGQGGSKSDSVYFGGPVPCFAGQLLCEARVHSLESEPPQKV